MAPSKDIISPKVDSREEVLEGLPGPIVKLLVEPYKLSYWYFELLELARKAATPPRPNFVYTLRKESISRSRLAIPLRKAAFPYQCQVAIVGLPSFFSAGSDGQLIITLLLTFLSFGLFVQLDPYHTRSVST